MLQTIVYLIFIKKKVQGVDDDDLEDSMQPLVRVNKPSACQFFDRSIIGLITFFLGPERQVGLTCKKAASFANKTLAAKNVPVMTGYITRKNAAIERQKKLKAEREESELRTLNLR